MCAKWLCRWSVGIAGEPWRRTCGHAGCVQEAGSQVNWALIVPSFASHLLSRALSHAHRNTVYTYCTLHNTTPVSVHLSPPSSAPQTCIFFTGVESVESLRFKTCELVSQNVMVMIISVLHLRYPVGREGGGCKFPKHLKRTSFPKRCGSNDEFDTCDVSASVTVTANFQNI